MRCRQRLEVVRRWQIPWAEVNAGGRLILDGRLAFGPKAQVAFTGQTPAATPQGWLVAEAAGGIELPKDVCVAEGFRLKLADKGRQLWLLRP